MMFVPALLFALATTAAAPVPGTQSATETPVTLTTTATIENIDHTNRSVTLKFDDGSTDTLMAGPKVTRFDQLKVGDKIKFHYYESVAYQLHKAGTPEPPPSSEDEKSALTPREGGPGGTLAKQRRETVTVVKLDPTQGSITVKAANGNVTSKRVKDKKRLTGIAVGDRIEIVYTEALLTSVDSGT
jgi:hypothetical protein